MKKMLLPLPDQKFEGMISALLEPAKKAIEKWAQEKEKLIKEAYKTVFGRNLYEFDDYKKIDCYNVQTGENTWTEYYVLFRRCFLIINYTQSYIFDYENESFTSDINLYPSIPQKLTIYRDENGKLIFE